MRTDNSLPPDAHAGHAAPAAHSHHGCGSGCAGHGMASAAPDRALWWRLGLAGVLAAASEGAAWWGAPPYSLIIGGPALLAIALAGLPTLRKGWIALRHLALNIHFLMSIAVLGAVVIGQWPEAAMVIVLFALSEKSQPRRPQHAPRGARHRGGPCGAVAARGRFCESAREGVRGTIDGVPYFLGNHRLAEAQGACGDALCRRTVAILRQNIAVALGIKALFFALALAGGATLWMAVFADVGASLLVIANGLRLLRPADTGRLPLSAAEEGAMSRA